MQRLSAFLDEVGSQPKGRVLAGSGAFAFQLHDTYGFPVDITRQVMVDRHLVLDEEEFTTQMQEQRTRARASASTSEAVFSDSVATTLASAKVGMTEFVGYESLTCESEIRALVDGDNKLRDRVEAGSEAIMVTASSPFYGEGGGQVGDRGTVRGPSGRGDVTNTTTQSSYHLHHVRVTEGALAAGERCELFVDEDARRATERHHTATHLLHAALKQEVGEHVNQAGSVVDPDRLRFFFTRSAVRL
jgi:alanyl-tRNA synthetase